MGNLESLPKEPERTLNQPTRAQNAGTEKIQTATH